MSWLDRIKIKFCCYSKCSLDSKEKSLKSKNNIEA